jgi:CheY-like chemotaxis protein
VLVIEDDADARELIRTTLTASGYHVRLACNGAEGILLARELLPAAITLDIMMPSVDGWRVLQSLKSEPRTASIPIVVCSIVDNRPLGYRLGASDYLIKPVEPNALLQSLQLVGAEADEDGSSFVLIVDDEPPVRELLSTALREAGFRSRAVPSGEVALATMPDRKPAAILTDLMMPGGMSGYEFIARLRSDPATSSIPVVVVTGKDLSTEDAKFLRGQIAEVIRKGDLALHDLQTRLRHTLQEFGVSP